MQNKKNKSLRKQTIRTLLLLTFIAIGSYATSAMPSIESSLFGELSKETKYTTRYQVTQTFDIRDWKNDTLNLSIQNAGNMYLMLKTFFFEDMKVSVNVEGREKWKKISYTFDGMNFHCILPKKNCKLKIEYIHRAMFYLCYTQSIFYLRFFLADWGTSYFTYPDMKFGHVEFRIPEGYSFFSKLPHSEMSKGHFNVNVSKYENEKDLSYGFFRNDYYQQSGTEVGNCKINIFCRDSLVVLNKKKIVRQRLPKEIVNQRLENIAACVEHYTQFFEVEKPQVFYLIDGDFAKDSLIWGCALSSPQNSTSTILIDVSQWDKGMPEHEILHKFMTVSPDKKDSCFYFFCESMVEYLSIALNKSGETEAAAFEKRYEDALAIDKETSIFSINENTISNDGSFRTIYGKTPWVLYHFSIQIGKTAFLEILKDFYKEVVEKQTINMPMLEKHLKAAGVSDEQYSQLIKNL